MVKSDGFEGNPEKLPGTLQDHTAPGSQGTGNYVSLTKDADNTHMLKDDFFIPASGKQNSFPSAASRQKYLNKFNQQRVNELTKEKEALDKLQEEDPVFDAFKMKFTPEEQAYHDKIKARFKYVTSELKGLARDPADPTVFYTFEYHVKNTKGVDTAKIGLEKEREVVTESVKPAQITAVRKSIGSLKITR